MMALSENLRILRTQHGISQEKLAERMQLSRQAIAKWESGAAQPDVEKLIALAAYYQITLDELVKGYTPCTQNRRVDSDTDIPTEPLIAFLLRAGASTYAGKGAAAVEATRPASHDLYYQEGDYRYIDTYLGGQNFLGEEALFVREQPIWGMNYCGRTLSDGFSGDFLKAALLQRPQAYPYRGPYLFTEGRYTYHNQVNGQFAWFHGQEEIFCDTERVYECRYHGGLVRA